MMDFHLHVHPLVWLRDQVISKEQFWVIRDRSFHIYWVGRGGRIGKARLWKAQLLERQLLVLNPNWVPLGVNEVRFHCAKRPKNVNSANSILEHEQTIASWKGGSQKATRADVRLTRLRARKAMSASFRQNRGQTPGG